MRKILKQLRNYNIAGIKNVFFFHRKFNITTTTEPSLKICL